MYVAAKSKRQSSKLGKGDEILRKVFMKYSNLSMQYLVHEAEIILNYTITSQNNFLKGRKETVRTNFADQANPPLSG